MIELPLHACVLALAVLLQLPGSAGNGPSGVPESSGRRLTERVTASAGVTPDTVTVGDHFRVVVRVDAPTGVAVEFPEFQLVEPVQAVDTLRVARDSTRGWTATYTLAAWRTSDSLVASFPVRVRPPQGAARDYRVRVRLPFVRSVLPADSALHLPKPAKAVIPIVLRGPVPRGWFLPAILLLIVLAGVAWLALRKRGAVLTKPASPRAAALAALEAIDRERLPERGMAHEYHVRTSRVLRQYVSAEGRGGEDLTSTELLASLRRAGADEGLLNELARMLGEADRVKFSGTAGRDEVEASAVHGEALRRWISEWPPAPAAPSSARAEAA